MQDSSAFAPGPLPPLDDPAGAARAARLRYVHDTGPGITRRRAGKGFAYRDASGRRLRDRAELGRIRALAIPPAWTGVWICPLAEGHIQATGRDARGRKQYRYHARWREVRDATKFAKMQAFGAALPKIRAHTGRQLSEPSLSRERVLAAVVRLLEATLIRVGNEEYARDNGSFGLTTMRDRHVTIHGATLEFHFRGKSGKQHRVGVSDARLARVVKRCHDLPGHELFQYVGDGGELHPVDSAQVNDYLREITGEDFTAKDFRTWAATVLALRELCRSRACRSKTEAKKRMNEAVKFVASHLGNTPAVCRSSYIHPAVLERYLLGTLPSSRPSAVARGEALHPEEQAALAFLRSLDRPSRAA